MQLRARTVVNSASLLAPALARKFSGLDAAHIPRDHLGVWAAEGKSLTSKSTARTLNKHGHQLPPV
jgi:hypothetical protein